MKTELPNLTWNVAIRAEGSLKPLRSVNFTSHFDARAFADVQIAQIKKAGWTHRVHVAPVVSAVQA